MAFPYPRSRRIVSPANLVAFVNDVHHDPNMVMFLDTLVVILNVPYPVDALREALSVASHVEDLILSLPILDTPNDILDGLHFARLEFFNTNLPHHCLTAFLSQQPSILCLCLGPCGREDRGPCPLQAHNLDHVVTAEYPVSCIVGLAHPKLLRLAVQSPCHLYNTPTTLRFIRPLLFLFDLTLDFFPDDYDVLESVVRVAPRLQKLKLVENHRTFRRREHARRPWNDAVGWSRSLFLLDNLECLSLRTSVTLLPEASAFSAEAATISKWASRKRRGLHPAVTTLQDHPTLSSMRIWYHRRAPGNGVITDWSKSTGTWRNIARIIAPPLGTPF